MERADPTGGVTGPVMFWRERGGSTSAADRLPTVTVEGALIRGRLELDGECLYVVDAGLRHPVLWEYFTRWLPESATVLLPDDTVLSVGDAIEAGGGYHRPDALEEFTPSEEVAELAARCAEEPYREVAVIQSAVGRVGSPQASSGDVDVVEPPSELAIGDVAPVQIWAGCTLELAIGEERFVPDEELVPAPLDGRYRAADFPPSWHVLVFNEGPTDGPAYVVLDAEAERLDAETVEVRDQDSGDVVGTFRLDRTPVDELVTCRSAGAAQTERQLLGSYQWSPSASRRSASLGPQEPRKYG
ncbi:MAG: hypothetical protein QNJ12_02590 [Ilumatobacter sp.]|uniref:hypothetical protein n=1 Tax=Ilumatobacter sp. TaxID=1967498 RepID=UPI002631000F|nr:hypothetical protein [Ilumatobacter sp.]MDJ0767646.1 hypothetical protein [Ilumatobacter sp.]